MTTGHGSQTPTHTEWRHAGIVSVAQSGCRVTVWVRVRMMGEGEGVGVGVGEGEGEGDGVIG